MTEENESQKEEESQAAAAFQEFDSAAKETSKFLGVVPTRYIRTYHGLIHALASLGSLLLGNLLFLEQVILGKTAKNDAMKIAFWRCTIISSLVTYGFFWNKVQSWQLSTTSIQEKGLEAKQMQNFNRGRGTLALFVYSLVPLVWATFPQNWLASRVFVTSLSLAVVTISCKIFYLIRDYGKTLFLIYGMYPALVALLAIIHGDLVRLTQAYPNLMTHFENQACFVIACVQFGFFWYYVYSRRMVSKTTVQECCKHYHPILFFTYVGCGLWRPATQGGAWWHLPLPLALHSLFVTLLGFLFVVKMIKTQWKGSSSSASVHLDDEPANKTRRRRSSLFEVEQVQTRRRSSVFEQIAELDMLMAAVSKED